MIDKNHPEQCWISLILRVSMALLFGVAAYIKFATGLSIYASSMATMFKDSFLPSWLVMPYINLLPFVEVLIAVWLLIGVRLRTAWIFTAFLMTTLAFGIEVNKGNPADNYIYVLIACLGIYLSKYDKCDLFTCCKK